MPALPPVSKCLRYQFDFLTGPNTKAGSRLFFRYSGGPPASADCGALAGIASGAFAASLASFMSNDYDLSGVVCTDLDTASGFTGQDLSVVPGTAAFHPPDIASATLINHHIDRRYRGGKPRTYFPLGTTNSMAADDAHWTTAYQTALESAYSAFTAAIIGSSSGTTTITDALNVSFYSGVDAPITLPSGRVKQASAIRGTPLTDVIRSSAVNLLIASQRRRRTSTTY